MRIVFLCSGGGGNLKFVAQAIRLGWVDDLRICAVLSDRHCDANAYAQAQGIPSEVLDFSAVGQLAVMNRLRALDPDLIVTTVHKVLVPGLVQAVRGKLVNLHYSLLPAFGSKIGARPVRAALDYGAKFVGVTVHWVDEGVDTGRPLLQAVTAVPTAPDPEALMNVLFRAGCVGLLHAITSLAPSFKPVQERASDALMLGGRLVHFNPAVTIDPSLEQEQGWVFLK